MADKNSLWTWDNQQKYHEKIMQEIEDNTTGGTGSLTIDTELSDTSENAVQNKVIKAELDKKLEADDLPEAKNITNEASGEVITVTDAVEEPLLGSNIYGKSTQDGTPSPTNPVPIVSVGDDGELKVQSCGKNLLPNAASETKTKNGLTVESLGDGSYHLYGTVTSAQTSIMFALPQPAILPKEDIYISLNNSGVCTGSMAFYDESGTQITYLSYTSLNRIYVNQATLPNTKVAQIGFYVANGETVDFMTRPQLELKTHTAYEPYTGSTATLTSALPLCGKAGVYDELIFKPDRTGKAVKRFHKETFDISALNKEVLTNTTLYKTYTEKVSVGSSAAKLCNVSSNYGYHTLDEPHFYVSHIFNMYVANEDVEAFEALGTVTVMYDLATPEEIELTAEEMAQLEQLYSYNGVTNVFNSEGAEMAVKYWCDNSIANLLENKAEKEHSHLVSDIEDFPTSLPASDVSAWAKAETKPTYTATEVGADPSGTATSAINALNVTDTAVDGKYVSAVSESKGKITVTRKSLPDYSNTYDAKGAADTALASAKSYADTKDTATLSSAKSYADTKDAETLSSAKSHSESYTDQKIADLINSAPTTLDTLGEIATAMEENADVVDALEKAVGNKANASDLTSHTGNKSNPHSVTKAQVGLGNVENKSSATIRSEITSDNVTDALGYTPMEDATVPIAKGGTGATTAKEAEYNLLKDVPESTAALTDNAIFVFKRTTPDSTNGVFVWKYATLIWNYIKTKISSVLGLTATQYNGNAKTATTAIKATGDSDGNAINTTYLKKSGGEMTGSITYPERANGSKVSYGDTGIVLNTPSDNGYAANLLAVHSEDNSTVLGGFGVHGSNDTITYYYIGGTYTEPTFKFKPNGELTATKFIGELQGNADTATNATKVNGHAVESDVPANAKFTDTTYTHPNSGATAGTYRSVTVNAQGHVTAGSNPTVTVAQGGTGATTANGAEYNILGGMEEITTDATDAVKVVCAYGDPSSEKGVVFFRTAVHFWNYVKSKADSVYAALSHTHTKSEITDMPTTMANPNALTVQLNGGTTEGTNKYTYTGSAAKTVNITPSAIGAAASSHGTHVTFDTTAPKANGTAAVGTATTVSRSDHVHPAQTSVTGSSGSCTGNAATATALTSSAGSATQPVYFSGGKPVETTYTLEKSVPSDAVFTDTTYSNFVKSGSGAKAGLVPAPSTTAGTTKYLREDGTWAVPPDTNTLYTHPTTSGNKHIPSGGSSGQFLKWSADGTAVWASDNNTTYTAGDCLTLTGTEFSVDTLNNTTIGSLGWTDVTTGATTVVTPNTLAYWNGQYKDGSSNLQYCKLGEFGSIVTKSASDYVSSTTTSIELNSTGALSGYGGFIDFHFNGSTADYTSRIVEQVSGTLTVTNGLTVGKVLRANGATDAATSQCRNISSGTAAATTTNCPTGALYGMYT